VNFYTLTAVNISTAGAVTAQALTGTTNTQAFPISQWRPMEIGFSSPQLASTIFQMAFNMTPTGAPGTYFFSGALNYRLIG
jgi:hypothetical protein